MEWGDQTCFFCLLYCTYMLPTLPAVPDLRRWLLSTALLFPPTSLRIIIIPTIPCRRSILAGSPPLAGRRGKDGQRARVGVRGQQNRVDASRHGGWNGCTATSLILNVQVATSGAGCFRSASGGNQPLVTGLSWDRACCLKNFGRRM